MADAPTMPDGASLGDLTSSALVLTFTHEDGTERQIRWTADGSIDVEVRYADGTGGPVRAGRFDDSGWFGFTDHAADGTTSEAVPTDTSQRTSVYGSHTERADYADGSWVEMRFDDDTRLTEVSVGGIWGHQTMEIQVDGQRSLRWWIGSLTGYRVWNASGVAAPHSVEVVAPTTG